MVKIIVSSISKAMQLLPNKPSKILISGGGRKNHTIVNEIGLETKIQCKNIDDHNLRGDAIEAEAFAFLAIRSFQGLPISFPGTTGCKKACIGGEIIKN